MKYKQIKKGSSESVWQCKQLGTQFMGVEGLLWAKETAKHLMFAAASNDSDMEVGGQRGE